jgi:hypothetical protein
VMHPLPCACRLYSEAATRQGMFGEGNKANASLPRRRVIAGTAEPRYEKGDRVFVRGSRAPRLPGVVIGHYVDWNLYRVVYMVDVAGQSPRAVEEWRLSPRRRGEER